MRIAELARKQHALWCEVLTRLADPSQHATATRLRLSHTPLGFRVFSRSARARLRAAGCSAVDPAAVLLFVILLRRPDTQSHACARLRGYRRKPLLLGLALGVLRLPCRLLDPDASAQSPPLRQWAARRDAHGSP